MAKQATEIEKARKVNKTVEHSGLFVLGSYSIYSFCVICLYSGNRTASSAQRQTSRGAEATNSTPTETGGNHFLQVYSVSDCNQIDRISTFR